jgi:eukaryotic-like serine/threonine-protein kinase
VASDIGLGTIVLGRYRIDSVVSEGSVAGVAAATGPEGARFAVKYLLPHAATDPVACRRFGREIELLSSLRSPHVPRIVESGALPGGAAFFVMDWVEGETLAATWRPGAPWSVARAVDLVIALCEALSDAHTHEAVHRNLTLSNIRIGTGVLLTGFGISKVSDTQRELELTAKADVLGDVSHMSPEQMMSSRDVDPRTDQWALGVVLYELSSGERPFRGTTLPQIAQQVLQGLTPQLRARHPELPEALEVIVTRCLEKNREARYANIAVLARALAPFASEAAAADRGAIEGRASSLESTDEAPKAVAAPTGRRGHYVVLGLVLAVGLAIALFLVLRGGGAH